MDIRFLTTGIDRGDTEGSRNHFRTYYMFLFHFEKILKKSGQNEAAIITQLFKEQKQYLVTSSHPLLSSQNRYRVQKHLYNAWNSELVARLNSSFDRSLRTVTNHWKPIQAYYALYFLLTFIQKVKVEGEFDRTVETHARTLKFATNSLCANLPKPWRCRYYVEEHDWREFPINPESCVKSGWNLSRDIDSYQHFAQFLRTTGNHKRNETWQKRKSEKPKTGDKRPRKKSIVLGYVSFWDIVWRFRRWANYLEARALLEGQEESLANEFDSSMNLVLMCSMAMLERVLSTHLGNDFMREAYDDYLTTIGEKVAKGHLTKHLILRRDLVCNT
jgi:hypothetical protein